MINVLEKPIICNTQNLHTLAISTKKPSLNYKSYWLVIFWLSCFNQKLKSILWSRILFEVSFSMKIFCNIFDYYVDSAIYQFDQSKKKMTRPKFVLKNKIARFDNTCQRTHHLFKLAKVGNTACNKLNFTNVCLQEIASFFSFYKLLWCVMMQNLESS